MAWKRVSTSRSIDADLDEFSNEQLLQGLIHAKWITENEAEAIQKRGAAAEKSSSIFSANPDTEELWHVQRCMRAGQRDEALIHLERFLGRDWIGVLQQ